MRIQDHRHRAIALEQIGEARQGPEDRDGQCHAGQSSFHPEGEGVLIMRKGHPFTPKKIAKPGTTNIRVNAFQATSGGQVWFGPPKTRTKSGS